MAQLQDNLKYLIHKNRLTQDEFGAIFDLGTSTVSGYLRGRTMPSLELLIKIADEYELNLNELVREDLAKKDQETEYAKTTMKEVTDSLELDIKDVLMYIINNEDELMQHKAFSNIIDIRVTKEVIKLRTDPNKYDEFFKF